MADAQLDLKSLGYLLGHLPRRQRLVLAFVLVHPLAQRGMGFLGMTVAPVHQRLPPPPARLVLGLKSGQVFLFDVQIQVGIHLVQRLACFDALE